MMVVNCAATTVKAVDPVMLPPEDRVELAVIVVVPTELASAKPTLTGATAAAEDVHVAEAVRSCVV